ncbi:hypothetical protein MUCCIDRAFT_164609 [Mucor lusitanicus CBS 277.49]|uniref:Uncharacterized protein n=1 Tax=Mucor lusitanicus CBS 277.49 TaxID=747725 RepID=A0A168J2V0_MUCCL|nr:hypothetical protein MUCCIDRAFT_164609 [Mucor lusitanicus CBS 277.49]
MTVNKRPLPPTPTSTTSTKYTNVNDAIQSLLQDTNIEHLTERERRWYTDLTNCHKAMEQKESTISNLKTIVMEWKKKAIEYENAYKAMKQKLEDREQFLIKQHQAEIEAITKTQTEQVNEHLELILQLETENQALKNKEQCQQQQLPNPNSANDIYTSSTMQLCNEAQMANKLASESVVYNKDNSDHLIQSINDMVNAMEGTLHEFRYHHHDEAPASYSPPALISDSSYSSSDESIDEPPSPPAALPQQPQQTSPKKRSLRNNFLFRRPSSGDVAAA